MTAKSFDELYETMVSYILTVQDRVTDFNPGSVASSFIEAVAREIATLYVRAQIGFSAYMRGLPYSAFSFPQKEGEKAAGYVVFSRESPKGFRTVVPSGTAVSDGTHFFHTSADGEILAGAAESAPVPVVAEAVGREYNLDSAMVSVIESNVAGDVAAVTNSDPMTGGEDAESWGDFAARFAEYTRGLQRTNYYGFKSAIENSGFVRSLEVLEFDEMTDGEKDVYDAVVILEDGSGAMSDEGIAEVKKIVDGDGTAENPGCRAAGVMVCFKPPETVSVHLRVTAFVTNDALRDMDITYCQDVIQSAVFELVNNKRVGESLYLSDVVVLVKQNSWAVHAVAENKDGGGNIEVGKRRILRMQSKADCEAVVIPQNAGGGE